MERSVQPSTTLRRLNNRPEGCPTKTEKVDFHLRTNVRKAYLWTPKRRPISDFRRFLGRLFASVSSQPKSLERSIQPGNTVWRPYKRPGHSPSKAEKVDFWVVRAGAGRYADRLENRRKFSEKSSKRRTKISKIVVLARNRRKIVEKSSFWR